MKKSLVRGMAMMALPILLAAQAGTASAHPASRTQPIPTGFEADSASFVSARIGFVLGARGCGFLPCPALVESTTNGGRTWTAVAAPKVSLHETFDSTPKSAVSSVLFANTTDGWLYGPGLWATTNGGKNWRGISLHGEVVAMAASDGVAFAAVQSPTASFLTAKLYKSRVGSGKWTLVRRVAPQDALTVSGHSVWAGIASIADPKSSIWRSTDSGKHWSRLSFHCPAAEPDASPVAAASPSSIAVSCTNPSEPQPGEGPKSVYTSANGGRTFHRAPGLPPMPGNVQFLAMPPGHPKVITLVAASGATFLYRSVNRGRTWSTLEFFDGGLEVRNLVFVTGQAGYLVHYNGGPALENGLGLMKTLNAGATWKSVPIP